ncbi:MAG: DUF5677 domain-containing protein [Phycisphaerae bacterium]|nr:DUF5677 domain-containing protein [Phycisphaerae bacterium]
MSNQEQDEKLLSMFAKTRALIETKNRENAMCTSVLDGAECYCNAIFLLLNGSYVFPAMALMRCLCELAVKLIWCLQCPDDMDKEQAIKTVDEKIRCWEKSTLAQNIKVLEEWKNVEPKNNNIDGQIKELENKKANMDVNEMPYYAQLLEKLPIEFSEISLELYKNFNKAVHLDANSLVKICLHNNKTNVNNSDISRLKNYCLLLAKNITGVIAINKSG